LLPYSPASHDGGNPPYLFGWGGGFTIPGGSYAILEALTVALLSCAPPRAGEWLKLLSEHVERDDNPEVWRILTHRLNWLSVCDRGGANAFLERLFTRYPEALQWREGILLLARVSWWAEESLVQGWVHSLNSSSWKHARYAYGELVGFLGVRIPPVPWAEHELIALVEYPTEDAALTGAAHSVARWWTDSPFRITLTPHLLALIGRAGKDIDEAILKVLATDQIGADDSSAQILEAFVRRAGTFPIQQARRAVTWMTKLVHSYPQIVLNLCNVLLQCVANESDATSKIGFSSKELVDLSITLQRIPGFLEQGLDLFEKLLELNLYGARQILDEVDMSGRAYVQ